MQIDRREDGMEEPAIPYPWGVELGPLVGVGRQQRIAALSYFPLT